MNNKNNTYKTSLAVMRMQPFHFGHKRLIDSMLKSSDIAVVVIGSIQEFRTQNNPFSYEERKQCLELTYKDEVLTGKLKIMGLADTDLDSDWSSYVLNAVFEKFKVVPQVYFFGDKGNGKYFEDSGLNLECKSREMVDLLSGTEIRKMLKLNLKDDLDKYIPQATKDMLKEKQFIQLKDKKYDL